MHGHVHTHTQRHTSVNGYGVLTVDLGSFDVVRREHRGRSQFVTGSGPRPLSSLYISPVPLLVPFTSLHADTQLQKDLWSKREGMPSTTVRTRLHSAHELRRTPRKRVTSLTSRPGHRQETRMGGEPWRGGWDLLN